MIEIVKAVRKELAAKPEATDVEIVKALEEAGVNTHAGTEEPYDGDGTEEVNKNRPLRNEPEGMGGDALEARGEPISMMDAMAGAAEQGWAEHEAKDKPSKDES